MKIKIMCVLIVFMCISSVAAFEVQPLEWASGIMITPQNPKPGDPVTFQVSIKATKDVGELRIVGILDTKEVFNKTYSIKAGKDRKIRYQWQAQTGEHVISFRIIPPGETPNEKVHTKLAPGKTENPMLIMKKFSVAGSQNTITPTLIPQKVKLADIHQPVCDGRPLPDLVANRLTVSGTGKQGTEHSIGVTVVNRGQCDSGPFSLRLEVYIQVPSENISQTKEIGRKSVHSLSPCRDSVCQDSTKTIFFQYTLLNKNFSYYDFTVEVDPGNDVEEFNEKNNDIQRSGSIKVENH